MGEDEEVLAPWPVHRWLCGLLFRNLQSFSLVIKPLFLCRIDLKPQNPKTQKPQTLNARTADYCPPVVPIDVCVYVAYKYEHTYIYTHMYRCSCIYEGTFICRGFSLGEVTISGTIKRLETSSFKAAQL